MPLQFLAKNTIHLKRHGLIRQFFVKKYLLSRKNPFQQVFFIARLIPLQAGKLYIISDEKVMFALSGK